MDFITNCYTTTGMTYKEIFVSTFFHESSAGATRTLQMNQKLQRALYSNHIKMLNLILMILFTCAKFYYSY